MIARTDQSIKSYRPELPLRERARAAHDEQMQAWVAERAAAFGRAQEMAAGSLVLACQRVLGLTVDRSEIVTAVVNVERTVTASTIVESIVFGINLGAADAAKLSGPISTAPLWAGPHCPVCGVALADAITIHDIADLGRLLGEVGCGGCGWSPST